jgi:hypothetical protein
MECVFFLAERKRREQQADMAAAPMATAYPPPYGVPPPVSTTPSVLWDGCFLCALCLYSSSNWMFCQQ